MPQRSNHNPPTSRNGSEAHIAADLAGMRHLYELNQRLGAIDSLDAALKEILALAIKFTETDRGNIQLFRPETNALEIVAHKGLRKPFLEHFKHNGCNSTCEAALKAKTRVVVENTDAEETLKGTKDLAVFEADGIHAVQSTPLTTRQGRVIGMLSTHFTKPHRPTEEQFGLIDLLALIAAEFIEHNRAEQAFRQNEERLKIVLEGIGEAFYALDKNWCFLFASQSALKMWNKKPEEIFGRLFLECFPETLGSAPYEVHQRVMTTGVSERFETVSPVLNRLIEVVIAPTLQGGLSVSFRDIEDNKRAEEELRESEKKYRSLFDTMDEGLAVCTVIRDGAGQVVDMVYRDVNAAVGRQTGLSRESFIGQRLSKVSTKTDFQNWLPMHALVADGGEPIMGESYSEFTGRWVEFSIYRSAQDENSIFVRDISARKRTEEALRESEEKYRTLFETIDEGINSIELIYDIDGKPVDFRYLDVNQAVERETGLKNIVGRLGSEVVPNSERYWLDAYDQVIRTGEPHRIENYNETTDRWFRAYAARIGGAESRQLTVVFSDITERKQQERKQEFLLKFSDALRNVIDPIKIQAIASQLLGEHLNANQVHYGETKGEFVVINQGWGNGLPPMVGTFRHQDFGKRLVKGYRSGKVQVCNDVYADKSITKDERKIITAAGFHAYIAMPLIKNGEWVSTLAVHSIHPRKWKQHEIDLVREVAERTWAAVERAYVEKALRESEEKYRAVFNSINEGFSLLEILFDEAGNAYDIIIRDANPAQNRVDGVQAMIGKRVREILPDIEDKWITRYADIVKSGKPEQFQDWSEANKRWYDVNASRVGDYNSNLIAIVYNDITDRKNAEDALRESEQKLKEFNESLEQQVKDRTAELLENHKLLETIYNTTHVGMSVFKPVYNRKNKITDFEIVIVNKRIEDSSRRKDLPGKLYSTVFPGIKKIGLFKAMVKAMETGKPVHMEYFYEYEGVDRWYSTMFIRNSNMLVSSNMDMTEQKLAEEKNRELDLRQKELVEKQQQEIFRAVLDTQEIERKRIAENLHNSLGQMLYAIKLSLGSVNKSVLMDTEKESLRNADKLLTDAISESRRLSHELMPVILEDFGLKAAVEDICRKLSGKVKIKCRFKGLTKKLDRHVETAVYRLVQELVMNAVKHSNATEAFVAVEVNLSGIVVSVQDNGKGFSTAREKGDGIGLKTIRNNVSLLNGHIDITSAPAKGTNVSIDIPYILK